MEELGALAGTPSTPELLEAKAALAPLLASWLDQYPEDFGDPQAPPLLEPLLQVLGPGSELARRLEALGGAPPPSPAGAPPPEEEEGEGEGQGGEGQDADPLEILSFQAREVAEELTRMDAELFLRLVPHECLGAFWSRRGQRGHEAACASVRATVGHFNRLAGAVVRSCLGGAGLRPPQRARLLEKWIRVAEECRALRNFSSLCAIVSALRSSPIHRLRQSWEETSREAQRSYEELSALCSEQDNYSASRRLLRQAGTRPALAPALSPNLALSPTVALALSPALSPTLTLSLSPNLALSPALALSPPQPQPWPCPHPGPDP